MGYETREEAGRELAKKIRRLVSEQPLVLALPRGGVPVASEMAKALGLDWDVLVVRKIGAPSQPELGVGAIAEEGIAWIDPEIVGIVGATGNQLRDILERETAEVARRVRRYRGERTIDVRGRSVLLVDDGLATGASARAACRYARQFGAKKVRIVVPAGFRSAIERLQGEADEVICAETNEAYRSVSQFYEDFHQMTDDEVIEILGEHQSQSEYLLSVPPLSKGLVIFAHGSGSSRFSPRNQYVARALEARGLATLLFDLPSEGNIPLLADRLTQAFHWAKLRPSLAGHRIGFFGASTGAAAALWAASELGDQIGAVVSRGGRPDLAVERLGLVSAPTLLIVGGDDGSVLKMNQEAAKLIPRVDLKTVPGATHLFEEPGALEEVAWASGGFFLKHLEYPVQSSAA